MTILGRRNRSASSSRAVAAQKRERQQLAQRRALWGEALESRQLMAGDVMPSLTRSPYFNIAQPQDVNVDGRISAMDALAIINELNLNGARTLSTNTGAGEGGANDQPFFVDVNNDNRLSAMDALAVINSLNSAGEAGPPLVRYTVQPVAIGTNDPITTIPKGGYYELRVLVEDLGQLTYMSQTRPATLPASSSTALGVFTSFFDVLWGDTTKTDVQVNESQHFEITGSPTTGTTTPPDPSTFTLSLMDGTLKTTAPITFASNRLATAANIQNALNTTLGAGSVEVTHDPSGNTNRWRIRFLNRLSNQDVPEMTANISQLNGTGLGTSVTETLKGVPSNAAAYLDATLPRVVNDIDGFPINTPLYYTGQRTSGSRMSTGINDVGGTGPSASPFPGVDPSEILRVRMNATDATAAGMPLNFNVSIANVLSGLETGLYGFSNPVTADRVEVVTSTLVITEKLSAGDDTATTTEGSTTPINIIVTTNDVNVAPTPNTTKSVVSVDMTGAVGTAVVLNSTTIRYTPPGGTFNGVDTFRYVVTDQAGNTDIGTVRVTITPVNNAPVITVPGAQGFNEDTSRTFSSGNGNAITVADADIGAGVLTFTLSVGAGNGNLTLSGTTGLTNVTGNGTSSISVQGNLTNLNNALEGLVYTPVGDANGTKTLTLTANDGSSTRTSTVALNIAAVNDAPTVTLGGVLGAPQNTIEGDSLVFSSTTNRVITIGDVDAGAANVVVTLSVPNALNKINVGAASGVTIGTNNTNSVTLTGTLSAINAALASPGFTYTTFVGFGNNTETLTITVNDQGNTGSGGALPGSATVSIVVAPTIRPRASNDTATVVEDSSVTIDVLANDIVTLPERPTVKPILLGTYPQTTTAGGTLDRDENGTIGDFTDDRIVYTPPLNFNGNDSFTYDMNDTDGTGANATGSVSIVVREMNDAPVANNDTLADIAEDSGSLNIAIGTLTGNDTTGPANESAQTLTISPTFTNVVGGTVILSLGNAVFTPTLNYNGPAGFDYTITDNGTTAGVADPKSSTARVSFNITNVNDAPTAGSDTLGSIPEGSAAQTISIASLLANDSTGPADENGQMLTLTNVTAGAGGTVSISGTDVIFTPNTDFNGTATFSYTITDDGTSNGAADPKTATGTVSIPVSAVNDAPVAVNDTISTGEGQQINISVLANDSDVDASPTFVSQPGVVSPTTTITIITPPTNGTAVVVGNQVQYTPNAFYNGPDSFVYQLTDNDPTTPGSLQSGLATVSISVVEKNDAPVAVGDSATTAEDTPVSIDVFANDSDPDTANTLWSFVPVTQPANGTISFNTTTRQVEYTPAANYNGPDSFTYKVNDGSSIAPTNLDSNVVTVNITVTEVNDAPTANNDPSGVVPFTVIKDVARDFNITTEILANDSKGPANESSQTLTLDSFQAATANGTITRSGNTLTYTPNPGYVGLDSFTYTISDNGNTNGVADPKTSTATILVDVKNFIPTTVSGVVYIDADNDGVFDTGEKTISGVDVTLAGTSDLSGSITPITVTTGFDGRYAFNNIEPGTYTVTESQPLALTDGKETLGNYATVASNDVIQLTLPFFGNGVSVNNFGERSIDPSQLANSAGLIGELLASSTTNGFVLATDMTGEALWSWTLNGWTNAHSVKVTLDADLSAATLECSDGVSTYTTRIYQNPNDTRNANRFNTDSVAKLARFRVLGYDSSGNYIIRLDGTAEHFYGVGSTLALAPTVMSGGEATSGADYSNSVDAAMMEESWA
ncbi:beta strand repeat-containing protein [Anatilimnocola sp. NA78]|uniref:beta strand repeat-containing protein n=1 Tax=Anatilimnocola sp. NA78 TaxID=3415683 RepID=UPI003CE54682